MSDFSNAAAAEPIMDSATSESSVLDLGNLSDQKPVSQLQNMDEIDFEKELMAIRASEDDAEIDADVVSDIPTKTTSEQSKPTTGQSDPNASSFDSTGNNALEDDDFHKLLQESDNNDEDFLNPSSSRHKSSASKTSIAIMNNDDNSIGPDVSMPPDGILENEDGSFSCYVIVPGGKAGMVIGTAGSTVKQMMAESKTKMNLVQDSAQNTGADKPLRIVGERECVLKAKEMVLHLINEGGAPSFVDLHVPKFAVGMIIGNRGATINKLQDEYGVRIQIKPDQNPEGTYRVCQILGEANKYQNAAQKVLDLVAAVEAKDKARGSGGSKSSSGGDAGKSDTSGAKTYKHEVHMTVHEKAVGRIIGRGGANIKRMMQESGAKIEMDKNNVNSKNGRVVFILSSTSMQSIEEAQDLVNEAAKKPDSVGTPNRDSNSNYYGGIGSSSGGSAKDRLGSRDHSSNRSFSRGYDSRDDSRNSRHSNSSNSSFNSSFNDRKRNPSNRSRSPDIDESCRTKVIKTEVFGGNQMNMNHNQQQQMQTQAPMMPMGMMPMPNQMPPNNFMPPMMPQMMAPPMMQQSVPRPAMPPGFPPMMAPPGMPGMPPFPLPGMPQSSNTPVTPMMQPPPVSMPMGMPPMPQMPSQPVTPAAPVNNTPSMPAWPGFPPMPTASNASNSAPSTNTSSMPSGNMFEMWMQYASKMAGNNQGSSSTQTQAPSNMPPPIVPSAPVNKPSNSGSSSSASSGGSSSNSSQDAWLKCYKIFMDTMQDKSANNPAPVKKEPEVKKEPVPEPKKDYTKEWQEYMAKLYAAGGAGSQMEAWKKWTEKYQEYLKTHTGGSR